ncbi:hypothetical protein KSP40_PGU006799 [Platanthera guangdongensis]|uniref:Uncharacterized protein n=1 Tax=Platanthera guangdongensis TaxID=2320717 RepID=A0ABR2MHH2_9ASPA
MIANKIFEIKSSIIKMIQNSVHFEGLPNEDRNDHMSNFLEICDTFMLDLMDNLRGGGG